MASGGSIFRHGLENASIHSELHGTHIAHTPFGKQVSQPFGWHQRGLKTIVKSMHISAGQFHRSLRAAFAQKFCAPAQIRFRKMGMIKTNDWNSQRATRGNRFPSDLIRIA
jgi:hypothetical protein